MGAGGYVFRSSIVVTQVAEESPAAEALAPGDLLTGAGGHPFAAGQDPRRALGIAIGVAEAADGKLSLTRRRSGKTQQVTVKIPVLGACAKTWPLDCARSEKIFAGACRDLVANHLPAVIFNNHVSRACNALLLLAAGSPEQLDIVRRAAYRVVDDPLTQGYQGWSRSYSGILLAEYYLRTGDPVVLPKLKEFARTIALGQMACGSWGHRMPWDGYGAVNQIGLACFLAMVLIEECGVDVDDAAMKTATEFFARYAGKGWVPYGDHVPWRGKSGNGKNALAAVVYDLLGNHDYEVGEFSSTTAASWAQREVGHTGAFFSLLWSPLGAARAPAAQLRQFLDGQRWYYDLARTWQGGFICQPNPENLSGRTGGTYTRWGPVGTTGAMALLYALPGKNLRILGAAPGLFSRSTPKSMARARQLYADHDYKNCVRWLESFLRQEHQATELDYARSLFSAAKSQEASLAWTTKAIQADCKKGDFYLAQERLAVLARFLGNTPKRLGRVRRTLEKEAKEIEHGQSYHRLRRNYLRQAGARGRMRAIAKKSKGYYGKLASQALANAPPLPPKLKWRDVVSMGRQGAQFDRPEQAAFLRVLAQCPADTRVYLNGSLVVDFAQAPKKPKEPVPLRAQALDLLRQGSNDLKIVAPRGRVSFTLQAAEEDR